MLSTWTVGVYHQKVVTRNVVAYRGYVVTYFDGYFTNKYIKPVTTKFIVIINCERPVLFSASFHKIDCYILKAAITNRLIPNPIIIAHY